MQPQPQKPQPVNANPYVHSADTEEAGAKKPRFLKFGVTYLVLNVPVYGLPFLFGIIMLSSARPDDPYWPINLKYGLRLTFGAGIPLAYIITAGVLAIRGTVAGVRMGLAHTSVFASLAVVVPIYLGLKGHEGALIIIVIGVLPHVILVVLALDELERHKARKAAVV
jgi:hypothetical protein